MDIAFIILQELSVIILLIGTGYLCHKAKILTEPAARSLCSLLLMIITPATLIHNLQKPRLPELLPGILAAFCISVVYQLMTILLATFFVKGEDAPRVRIQRMGVVFPNCGFMAFPLIAAAVSPESVIYATIYVGVFHMASWTWGYMTITGTTKISVRQVFINPGFLGFAVAITLFLLNIRLPKLALSFTGHLYTLNTPLSMMAMGVFLCAVYWPKALKNLRIYWVAMLRTVVSPLLLILLLYITGFAGWFSTAREVAYAMTIVASCPSAVSLILMSARFGGDSHHGAEVIAITTALSLVTMPVMIYIAQQIL